MNAEASAATRASRLAGARGVQPTAQIQLLTASDLNAMNTLDIPTKVSPATSFARDVGTAFRHQFPAYSLTVMRITAAAN